MYMYLRATSSVYMYNKQVSRHSLVLVLGIHVYDYVKTRKQVSKEGSVFIIIIKKADIK